LLQVHNDQFDNLYAIVAGSKKVVLFDPQQSPYLYEDKYVMAKGKVSAINFETPDYTKHPWQRYLRYKETTVETGDILFIPIYWWHQVYSQGRSIGVTHWFDYWKKSSLVGGGNHQGSEKLIRTFRSYMSKYGKQCEAPNKETATRAMPLSEWKGCKASDSAAAAAGACQQVTARHDFCSRGSGLVSHREEDLVKRLLDLWQMSQGESIPQTKLAEEYTRREVNAAVAVLAPCGPLAAAGEREPESGQSPPHESPVRYTEFVEYVGNVLYFQNPSHLAKLRAAGEDKAALSEALDGFSHEEAFRLLLTLFDSPELEYNEIAGTIAKKLEGVIIR